MLAGLLLATAVVRLFPTVIPTAAYSCNGTSGRSTNLQVAVPVPNAKV
jgi:hypothetical protein